MKLSQMSASGLAHRIIFSRAALLTASTALIAAGRDREAFYITEHCTDALSVRYVAATARVRQLERERARRMVYHGSLKPIPIH